MPTEPRICNCTKMCANVDDYLSKHFSWAERMDDDLDEKPEIVSNWLIKMRKVRNDCVLKELQQKPNMPACTCKEICDNPEQYIRTHLYDIAWNCADDDGIRAINEYLYNNFDKIEKDLNSEGFARFHRLAKNAKKAANIAAGRPPVQPVPPHNPNMENEMCWKGVNCTFPNCRRIHPDGRNFVHKKGTKRQACFKASRCPNKENGCPFYHNPAVQYYDESVARKSVKYCFYNDNCTRDDCRYAHYPRY
jgi:hypothetical protein